MLAKDVKVGTCFYFKKHKYQRTSPSLWRYASQGLITAVNLDTLALVTISENAYVSPCSY